MELTRAEIILLSILLISGSILIFFFKANQGYWWDEAVYLGLARNLYEGRGYFINDHQESFRAPLFPLIIFTIWKIFGFSETLIRILPPLFAILSIPLIYLFSKKLYGEKFAVWPALILATFHMFIFYSVKILTESLFILLSLLFLYFFYLGTKNKKLLPVSGIFLALSFLTRYPAYAFCIFYLLYPLLANKKLFKNKYYWCGIASFLIMLVPWLWFNQITFGSPIAFLFVQAETVTTKYYIESWYYYFTHWIELFGLVGFFAIPGTIALFYKIKERRSVFLLTLVGIILLVFMIIPRKELRYLVSFYPAFALLFSVGIFELGKWMRSKKLIPLIAVFFCFLNLFAGIQMILFDLEGGKALKEAGFYLSEIVPENTTIMSNNMPVLFYTTGRRIVYFPEDKTKLNEVIEKNNVSFLVIEYREPTYPDYVWEVKGEEKIPSKFLGQNFLFEKSFNESNRTFVWVYKVKS